MADREEEVQDTSDYKLDKKGRKVKAHRIVFRKGEDDGNKGIKEGSMKKTYNNFVQEHTLPLTEEQLDEIVSELQEVLGKDAKAGDWISDFVHSDNPKFAGKSKEKRKQMALAAFYAKQRNEQAEIEEALKGKQHKLDKNKNGKLDAHDFKLLRKEELDEALHPEADKVLKHIKPEHQDKYKADLAKGVYKGDFADRTAVLKAAKSAGHLKEDAEQVDESAWDYKSKRNDGHKPGDITKTKHEVSKSAAGGTVYTKQYDVRGTAKGQNSDFKRDPDEAKRGRGRPKKNKFSEAVEFLMGLDEETFDSLMEEGFDSFMEHFEQLDELSKATLGSYAKKAAADSRMHAYDSGYVGGHAQAHAKHPSDGIDAGAKEDKKSFKRLKGVKKAIDRLTK